MRQTFRSALSFIIKSDMIDRRFHNSADEFKKISDVIIVNRLDNNVEDVKTKVYTRDLFARD